MRCHPSLVYLVPIDTAIKIETIHTRNARMLKIGMSREMISNSNPQIGNLTGIKPLPLPPYSARFLVLTYSIRAKTIDINIHHILLGYIFE
jgi:hypothetical protein